MKTINFGGRYGLLAGNFGGRKESGLGCGCARLKRVAEQNPSRLDMDGLCLGRPNGAVWEPCSSLEEPCKKPPAATGNRAVVT